MPPHMWRSWFGETALAEAVGCDEGDSYSVNDAEGGSTVEYGRRQPRCHRCKLDIPVDELDRAARTQIWRCSPA